MASRRRFLSNAARLAGSSVLLLPVSWPQVANASEIIAVRVWPAKDYSRVTIETRRPLSATHFTVDHPDRLVVDIDQLALDAGLRDLVSKIEPNDPYIKQVRVGQYRPNVVRIVFDLKTAVNPQLFTLPPVSEYQYRMVFDLYPAHPDDPLLAAIAATPGGDAVATPPLAPPDDGTAPVRPPEDKAPPLQPAEASADTKAGVPASKAPSQGSGVTRMVTIALDPGHGGEDPGAIGEHGTYEKHVALSIAQRIKVRIESEPNMRCMLTRDADYFVPLNVRVQKARRVQADLFVSVHADAFVTPDAHGSSVFALSEKGASSTAARWLAKKENDADLIGGVNISSRDQQLARVLLDLSTTAQIHDSLKLGSAVLREIGGINRLHRDAVEQAGFAVLKAPDIPSILVETAFISNPDEERRLNDIAYQDHMADAIVKGIKRYFAKNPPAPKSRLIS